MPGRQKQHDLISVMDYGQYRRARKLVHECKVRLGEGFDAGHILRGAVWDFLPAVCPGLWKTGVLGFRKIAEKDRQENCGKCPLIFTSKLNKIIKKVKRIPGADIGKKRKEVRIR